MPKTTIKLDGELNKLISIIATWKEIRKEQYIHDILRKGIQPDLSAINKHRFSTSSTKYT